jgi:Alpha/beta hydrolase domain
MMKMVIAGIVLMAMMATVAAGQSQPHRVTIPVPKVNGPIPITAGSHPFMAANINDPPIDLAARGYVEEEFFVGGTGNVYDWQTDGTIKVRSSGLPYTTRILIRRPSNRDRFSGTVLVDVGNRAQTFDTFAVWGQLQDHLLSSGHIWVGLTAFSVNIGSMKKLDAARYASLSFPKPMEQCGPPNRRPEFEDGVRWDVISQVAALLKSESTSNPLSGYGVQHVYAAMQSGGDLPTYVAAISHNVQLENQKPVYDAYLIKDSGGPGPLNACAPRLAAGDPRIIIRNAGVPVIQILSQNSIGANTRRPDSDVPGDQFRRYELPGSSHFDRWHFMYRPPIKEINAMGIQSADYFVVPRECEPRAAINDFPQPYFFAGAFYNLDQWVRKGVAPPKAAPVDATNDEFGNVRGGVRSPWLDVPSGTFYPAMKGPSNCADIGYWIPFSWQRLESIYGSYENYSKKFLAAVDRLAKERWVTPSDAEKIKAELLRK